jgi:hypothetical protein
MLFVDYLQSVPLPRVALTAHIQSIVLNLDKQQRIDLQFTTKHGQHHMEVFVRLQNNSICNSVSWLRLNSKAAFGGRVIFNSSPFKIIFPSHLLSFRLYAQHRPLPSAQTLNVSDQLR